MKAKIRKPVPVNWVFKIKEDPDRLFFMKSRNIVKVYTQVPVVHFADSFSIFVSDTSTRILIGMTLYH